MKNPWLDIPLADYEGHMALPHVGQAQLLSDVFADALHKYLPGSVAILGCAGGNGLERIDTEKTQRVVCVDINPHYVEQTHTRFGKRVPHLESIVGDIQTDDFAFAPVDLVFAGLFFEHVDVAVALVRIRPMLTQSGVLITAVQLPSAEIPEVTPSSFISLNALSSTMRFVLPESLTRLAVARGYCEITTRTVRATGGKRFQVQAFQLDKR